MKRYFYISLLWLCFSLFNVAYGVDAQEGAYVSTTFNTLPTSKQQLIQSMLDQGSLVTHLHSHQEKILLVRRFVSGEANSRGGNIWQKIETKQIDNSFVIHYKSQKLDSFKILPFPPDMVKNKTLTTKDSICKGAARCDLLPLANELEDKLYSLEPQLHNGRGIVVFSDGMLLCNFERIGEALVGNAIFLKEGSSFSIGGLIIFM